MNTQLQQEIRQLWCDNLGCPTAEEADNYFVCGGTSISAIRLLSAIRDQLGVTLDYTELFEYQTLEALSRRIAAALTAKEEAV
ncbi:phosphopantetheine-binding protein [Ruminococcus champanellensis]|uniref:Phosphopantetheine attachment site n=1 Tax=Ruminococcus champanellensis (strain DSM 18848 / JCM 17042 / KCTC 15320 / 18P13) TaxID=213810 RepID=D4L9P9_RUMC1|nr:phosphopantetheine-binding protein [Ruminococcus champanellensis]MED9890805.1 phosphopantetheine-binding protein [Ruminococcus champanellensis]CBL16344.1 Phosphopantetheine attachment site [Ruminococcus champanellensis 18P13 = JCM 17042]